MKAMIATVQKSSDEFCQSLRKSEGSIINVRPLLHRLSLDNICRTGFSVDVSSQLNLSANMPLLIAVLESAEAAFDTTLDLLVNCFEVLSVTLRVFLSRMFQLRILKHHGMKLEYETRKIVKRRRNAPPMNDIMQGFFRTQALVTDEQNLTALDGDRDNERKSLYTKNQQSITLSDDDVVANSALMIAAGMGTTSTSLAFTFHLLAKHRDVQDRLREEILESIDGNENSEELYSKVMNLKYLNRCLQESLRLYSPVTGFTTRFVSETTEHNGLLLSSGLSVKFPMFLIHNNPRVFSLPDVFNPDRFEEPLPHPLAYQPFGIGPRNCVGMRLAMLSMKLTMCTVLRQFRISTDQDIELISDGILNRPGEVNVLIEAVS